MAQSSWCFLAFAVSCTFAVASGQLIGSLLGSLTAGPLTQVLDLFQEPLSRSTSFDALVPQANIKLFCARPFVATDLEQVFLSDVNISQKLDLSRPLTVVTHGWLEASNIQPYLSLTERFRRFVNGSNYCVLDWQPYAAFAYTVSARRSVPLVAQFLFGYLSTAILEGYPMDQISLVGFSLGGQISGLTGKKFRGQLGAIYALDPAGVFFTHPVDVGPEQRLTGTDALYVQVVYTTRFTVGMGPLVGTQNFLPNGGFHPQAPCASVLGNVNLVEGLRCSHMYAVILFTATLDPDNPVVGRQCSRLLGRLSCFPTMDRLGIYSQRIPGDYYI